MSKDLKFLDLDQNGSRPVDVALAEAALIQTVATQAVQSVEHHLGDLPAEQKRQKAYEEAVDLLRKTYTGADMWFGFNPVIDFLALELLIPLIPKALDGIVALFNKTGVFSQGASGTP